MSHGKIVLIIKGSQQCEMVIWFELGFLSMAHGEMVLMRSHVIWQAGSNEVS